MTRAVLVEPRDWSALTHYCSRYCSRVPVSARIAADLACVSYLLEQG